MKDLAPLVVTIVVLVAGMANGACQSDSPPCGEDSVAAAEEWQPQLRLLIRTDRPTRPTRDRGPIQRPGDRYRGIVTQVTSGRGDDGSTARRAAEPGESHIAAVNQTDTPPRTPPRP